jgi:hypothetical protein
MGRSIPNRPGWYHNPDDPRSLRYWDGRFWTLKARPRPPWTAQAGPFEPSYEDFDRSIEGPVHPHELREPVASGAWSREWLAWRPRHSAGGWHRARSSQPAQPDRPPRPPVPPRLSPSRRPLLALTCLLVVAVGAVLSSVDFISPYETRSDVQVRDEVAVAHFVSVVNKQCQAVLPRYRGALAWGNDGPTIQAAAVRVEVLSDKIASLKAPQALRGPLQQWLSVLGQFAAEQSRYASIIGSATHLSGGRMVARPLSPSAQVAAAQVRQEAAQLAGRADAFATSDLQLASCRLEPVPAA